MVERSLSMREVAGSMPASSTPFCAPSGLWFVHVLLHSKARSTVSKDRLHIVFSYSQVSLFLFPAPCFVFPASGRRAVNRLQRRRLLSCTRRWPAEAPKRPPHRYLPTCTEPCVATNGSALYWAGSQLQLRPIGKRLLVSWQSGVPAPRLSGFVWVPGGGPGCRGPRCRLASGRGSGSSGPERGEGLCVDCGRAARPRPLLSARSAGARVECHPAPRPAAAGRPRLWLTTSAPVASPLTPRTSLPILQFLCLDPSHASKPHPALDKPGRARVPGNRGAACCFQAGLYWPSLPRGA